jgi:predicted nucleic acid-binding protein
MIHLDTNFLIQSLVPGAQSGLTLQAWLASDEELGISTIAWSEFLCGPLSTIDLILAQRLFPVPEPFLSSDAERSADLFNLTGRRSRSLADCQIAAVALRCGAGIATVNSGDFSVFQPHGLILV